MKNLLYAARVIFQLGCMALYMTACNLIDGGGPPDPDRPDTVWLVHQVRHYDQWSGGSKWDYKYNKHNKLVEIAHFIDTTGPPHSISRFTYDSRKRWTGYTFSYLNGNPRLRDSVEIFYDNRERIIKAVDYAVRYYYPDNQDKYKDTFLTYRFDYSGDTLVNRYYKNYSYNSYLYHKDVFTYSTRGNLLRTLTFYGQYRGDTIWYHSQRDPRIYYTKYDNAPNISKSSNLPAEVGSSVNEIEGLIMKHSNNNVTAFDYFGGTNVDGFTSDYSYRYTYWYNEKGLVAQFRRLGQPGPGNEDQTVTNNLYKIEYKKVPEAGSDGD